jgi:anaerobic ribonucleoside-triphosphate reductase activating protein
MMIRTDDMLNGSGLRVICFCTACDHYCDGCHNPETWDAANGKLFDDLAKKEIFHELENDYISGLTLSGGDPLNKNNLDDILLLVKEVKEKYPNKSIWIYSGYTWDYIYNSNDTVDIFNNEKRKSILNLCDVFVDGKFEKENADVKYPWAGSTNQRVIDVQKTLEKGEIVLWE